MGDKLSEGVLPPGFNTFDISLLGNAPAVQTLLDIQTRFYGVDKVSMLLAMLTTISATVVHNARAQAESTPGQSSGVAATPPARTCRAPQQDNDGQDKHEPTCKPASCKGIVVLRERDGFEGAAGGSTTAHTKSHFTRVQQVHRIPCTIVGPTAQVKDFATDLIECCKGEVAQPSRLELQ